MLLSDITIRDMTSDDLPEVLALETDYFPEPWSETVYRNSMALDYYIFLAAEEKTTGGLVGYASLMDAAGEGNIMNIAVAMPYRCKGGGSRLLCALLDRGRGRGIRDFTLEVRMTNAPAIHMYEKMGFRTEGIRRGYYEQPREDALIMWKREKGI